MENKDQSGGYSACFSDNPNPCPICLGPVVEDSYLDKCFRTSLSLSPANPFVRLPRKFLLKEKEICWFLTFTMIFFVQFHELGFFKTVKKKKIFLLV